MAHTVDVRRVEVELPDGSIEGIDANLVVPLEDLAGQAARWRPGIMPRALAGHLTRRLLFLKNADSQGAELARLQSCENRSVAAFLRP